MPFKKILERYGVVETSSNVDRHVRIDVDKDQLSYEFTDTTPLDLRHILLSLGVKPTFQNVFPPNVGIKMTTFDVDLVLQIVDVTIETTSGVDIGKNVMTLEKGTVTLKRIQNGAWSVGMTSDMKLGDAVMKVEVSQFDEQYSLTGMMKF